MSKPLIFLSLFILLASINLVAVKFTSKLGDGSYFIMEKVDDENIDQWYKFVTKATSDLNRWKNKLALIKELVTWQEVDDGNIKLTALAQIADEKINELIRDKNDPLLFLQKKLNVLNDAGDGISNFQSALGNKKNGFSDVWICYISLLKPTDQVAPEEKNSNIEISVVVLVKENSPVSMHMGIFRNPDYFMSSKSQHARISPDLHAFAANIALKIYPTLQAMVITPLSSMANIFKSALPVDSYAEGMNKKGAWIYRDKNGENNKPTIPHYDGFKFVLYDRDITDQEGKPVLLIDDKNKDEYWWLVGKLHASLDRHPYFAVNIDRLAGLFDGDIQALQ